MGYEECNRFNTVQIMCVCVITRQWLFWENIFIAIYQTHYYMLSTFKENFGEITIRDMNATRLKLISSFTCHMSDIISLSYINTCGCACVCEMGGGVNNVCVPVNRRGPGYRWSVTILDIHPNLIQYDLSIKLITFAKSFRNFAQSTAVSLPCSTWNCKTIEQLRHRQVWSHEISV